MKTIILFLILMLFFCNSISAQTLRLVLPIGHAERINSVHFNSDGKIVYTSSGDKTIKFWDTYSGKLLTEINGEYNSNFISPNGKKMLTYLDDSTILIYDLSNISIINTIKSKNGFVWTDNNYFSPDGEKIVFQDTEGTIVWDLKKNLPIFNSNDKTEIANLQFSADSKDILTVLKNGKVRIWNIATGKTSFNLNDTGNISFSQLGVDAKKLLTISFGSELDKSCVKIYDSQSSGSFQKLADEDNFTFASFSHDNKKIITISNKVDTPFTRFKIWDSNTGKLIHQLSSVKNYGRSNLNVDEDVIFDSEYLDEPQSAKLNIEGNRLLAFYKNGTIKLWDIINGKLLLEMSENNNNIMIEAHFSKDGKRFFSIARSNFNYPIIWDATSGKKIIELQELPSMLLTAVFSPDESKILCAYEDTTAKLWDVTTGINLINYLGHTKRVSDIQFSPNNESLLFAKDNDLELWDIISGSEKMKLKGHNGAVNYCQFDTDGKRIVSASDDRTAKIWNAHTGILQYSLKEHKAGINYTEFSKNQSFIITASFDGDAIIWDSYKGISVGSCLSTQSNEIGESSSLLSAHFSNNGNRILTRPADRNVKLWAWNGNTREFVADLKLAVSNPMTIAIFSPDSKKIFAANNGGDAAFWDATSGRILYQFNISPKTITTAQFSPDSKRLLLVSDNYDPQIIYLDNDSKKVINFTGHKSYIKYAEFSPDFKKIVTASADGTAKIWDAETGLLLIDLIGHTNQVVLAHFSPDQNKIVTTSKDNTIKIWTVDQGKLIYTFFIVDSTAQFTLIPTGYYKASHEAAKLLHYVNDHLKIITFEQLDVKYNRPDKVLEAIGSKDTSLINAFRQAYFKRIEKLGLDTFFFKNDYNVPESDIDNKNIIVPEQKNESLHLILKAKDDLSIFDRYNIWVNEVPLYGQKGISIRNKNIKIIDSLSVDIKLSEGKNKIEFSVFNVNGIESYRQPLFVTYNPSTPPKGKTYFIGIGINKFASNTNSLNWCVNDIRDLTLKLQQKLGSQFIVVDTLFNQRVTLGNIKKLKEELLKTGINDRVIIMYSGHGLLSAKYDYYLSSYNVNFKAPENDGIPYDELEGLLDSIPARNKLLLLDACNSGEVDKDSQIKSVGGVERKGIGDSVEVVGIDKNKLGLANSFELMRELFVNVNRGTGATVIAAAQGYQSALEQNTLGHGVFTYSILEALEKNHTMKISELKKWVSGQVVSLTGGKQQPTTRIEPIDSDWNIW
jgi:WD40 repeat protein